MECKNCKFWDEMRPRVGGLGKCHVLPPVIVGNDAHSPAQFPVTESSDWCGKFEEKSEDDD